MRPNARIPLLLLAVAAMGTGARATELPAFGAETVPGFNPSVLFRASLAPPPVLGLTSGMPDIDFTTGRENALPGMSERDVFLNSFLAPRLNSRLGGLRAAVTEFSDPNANPWTRTWETQDQVRRNAESATKSAVKRYALERLNLTGWSLPLGGSRGKGVSAFRTESGGPRLRFGFSHRAPRVDVLFPLDKGKVAFSADPLGRVGTSFETSSGRLRFGLSLDPREHEASFGLLVSI
jgi:hypothetical protein